MNRTETNQDLIIAGGGLAGLVQAVLLGSSGWRIMVLERGDGLSALSDPRSLALSESTRSILDEIGAWDSLRPECAEVTRIDVSQRGAFGSTRLHAEDEQLPALGYVVPAGILAKILRETVDDLPNCTFMTQTSVEEVEPQGAGIALKIQQDDTPQTVCGRLLIAADGARSALRDALGLHAEEVDYDQSAVVAEVEMDRAAEGWAYERFTRTGPLALLPHPSGRRALVWALSRKTAREARTWPDSKFCRELQQALGSRAGQVINAEPRNFYDLTFRRVQQRIGTRCVLIGDAAYSFHPVAAQGFNLVVRDAAWLAQVLGDAKQKEADPGAPQLLEEYAQVRDTDARRVAGFTDLLARGFVMQNPLIRGLRAASLFALEGMPQCRTRLVRFGMGADLPRADLALKAGRKGSAHA
ncbi:MAG: FAD-dependent monooxygenase [Gammaproteobacteria bacterium]|nr:FAD-dependent monooxygenase [Gammaproteobacteria bacterium]